jgi:hypothetical protein
LSKIFASKETAISFQQRLVVLFLKKYTKIFSAIASYSTYNFFASKLALFFIELLKQLIKTTGSRQNFSNGTYARDTPTNILD